MMHENLLYKASVDELIDGYVYDTETKLYRCIFCYETRELGIIYPYEGHLMDARRAMCQHVQDAHNGSLQYLLSQGKSTHGLSDAQREIMVLLASGTTDKEIAKQLGIAPSTVRNQRFMVREKVKQAKVLLAINALIGNIGSGTAADESLIEPIKGVKMMDERFVFTQAEHDHVLKQFFDKDVTLTTLPAREKRKIIALHIITTRYFEPNREYTEREVNEILAQHSQEDHVTLRRYLIAYGFLDRLTDGSKYWVRGSTNT